MHAAHIALLAVTWLILGVGVWLGWQLLRQNGRILLRLDEIEERLHELGFGEGEELAQESSAEAAKASRFGSRSLARSRINRSGLKAGERAPEFRLPRLDGGELALEELCGRRVLLVFSDPHCGPCNALAPQLEKLHRESMNGVSEATLATPCAPHAEGVFQNGAQGVTPPAILVISRGEPKENRAKAKEHGLTFPIVLQQRWEISRRYAMFATPAAYLIDEAGIIASDVAVGVEPILALLAQVQDRTKERQLATR